MKAKAPMASAYVVARIVLHRRAVIDRRRAFFFCWPALGRSRAIDNRASATVDDCMLTTYIRLAYRCWLYFVPGIIFGAAGRALAARAPSAKSSTWN